MQLWHVRQGTAAGRGQRIGAVSVSVEVVGVMVQSQKRGGVLASGARNKMG